MECITPQAPGTLWQSASLTKLSLMENSDRHSEEGNPPGESQMPPPRPPPWRVTEIFLEELKTELAFKR